MRFLLFPISLIYGIIIFLRNLLFDIKILPSKSFDIPVISVGNISVGGTGKTPHVEYLIKLLKKNNHLAVLSRGYRRNTKGYITATDFSSVKEIGDEPRQYKQKFDGIEVAVCECRKTGIKNLLKLFQDLSVILLDDAFQHRWVKPGLSILLTDYHYLYSDDYLLPVGNLREFRNSSKRANIIVISKTPSILSPILRRSLLKKIKLLPKQNIYFSFVKYGEMKLLPNIICENPPKKHYCILLITGIANPDPLEEYIARECVELEKIKFPDHHKYSVKDMMKIRETFHNIASVNKIIVTTEKDAMRLESPDLLIVIQGLPIYYIPIETEFHKKDKTDFDKKILDYVKKNQRNN